MTARAVSLPRVTQAQIRRAVKGAQDAGLVVSAIEVEGERIRVLTAPTSTAPHAGVDWLGKLDGDNRET